MELLKTAGRGFLTILAVFAFMGLAACEEEGSAEKAGKKIDEATKDLKKSLGN